MTSLFQIRAVWTDTAAGSGTNTLYGSEGDVSVHDMRVELGDAYTEYLSNHASDEVSVLIPSQGDVIDSTNGALLGIWTDGADVTITGASGGDRVTLASQVLVQIKTDDIVGGRRLHGRIFLPGCLESQSDGGFVGSGVVADTGAAFNTAFVNDFAVYSPTHHEWATCSGAAIWNQFAVLRSRRT